jgi:hypothetical protein
MNSATDDSVFLFLLMIHNGTGSAYRIGVGVRSLAFSHPKLYTLTYADPTMFSPPTFIVVHQYLKPAASSSNFSPILLLYPSKLGTRCEEESYEETTLLH